MGEAIISGIAKDNRVFVCEKDVKRGQFLKKKFKISLGSVEEVLKKSEIIVLAVKPQDFDELLMVVKNNISKSKLVVSIAAGITTEYIEKRLGDQIKVVRTMPNLPAQVGSGMTALTKGRWAKDLDLKKAQKIFDSIGETVVISEDLIDAVTAISGSGPAYVFLFIENMEKIAASFGLTKEMSRKLVLQTFQGSLKLLKDRNEEASDLKVKVTSKGGTTQAALEVFEKNNLAGIFTHALQAAKRRAGELSKN